MEEGLAALLDEGAIPFVTGQATSHGKSWRGDR